MLLRRRLAALAAAGAVTLAGIGAITSAQAATTPAADIMFSAYIEGYANNKAYELYNPTDTAIDLSGYRVEMHANGNTNDPNLLQLTGTLQPGGHLVVINGNAGGELRRLGDVRSNTTYYNGNDTLLLKKGDQVVDSFGQLGVNPGKSWNNNGVNTWKMSLWKKGCTADTDPTDAFDPSADWNATGQDDFSGLRTINCRAGATPSPTVTPAPGVTLIGAVQGTTDISPLDGKTVTVEGVVTGSFPGKDGFNGYYIQDAGDNNPATSDGLFIYAPADTTRKPGDRVRVKGKVSEFYGQTQLSQSSVEVLETGASLPAAQQLTLPIADHERYEGMYVTFPDALTILEYYNFGRYGEIVYGTERQYTGTAVAAPGDAAKAVTAANLANRIKADDGRGNQNPTPAIHPNGEPFSVTNFFRGGDKVSNLTGVLSYRNNEYKVQPTKGADYQAVNERPGVPEVGGNFKVSAFNVLNYFTTLTSQDKNARGADTPEEFERQQGKIVEALSQIDADVFGFMEIENNGTAVENLVKALNAKLGKDTYKAVNTGRVGTDAIFQAFIYKQETTEPVGAWKAYDFKDQKNRPSLTQTFRHKASGELVNVNVNHLKSKGSNCNDLGDPDKGDGAGNCDLTRTKAAKAITEWLAGDPTGQGAARTIVMGDLNSYDHEQPIQVFKDAGYTDLEHKFGGEQAYSYVFDGQLGYLDYGLANEAATKDVTGTASWHINADEVSLFDYDMSFKKKAEQDLYQLNPYRSSDHDPVIIGLQLDSSAAPVPTVTVTPTVTADPVVVTPTVTGAPITVTPTVTGEPVVVTPTVTGAPITVTPTVTGEPVVVTPTVTGAPITVTPTVTGEPVVVTPTVTGAPVTVTPTVTAPTPTTPAPKPTAPVLKAPYEVPGFHTINGRRWNTTCEPYGNTIRCWTYIWSKQAVKENGQYRLKEGWHFNNLTYLPYLTKAQWGTHHLANTGEYNLNGRKWRTECNTKVTGKNACRSYIWATVIVPQRDNQGRYTYRQNNQWVFNSMVRFKTN